MHSIKVCCIFILERKGISSESLKNITMKTLEKLTRSKYNSVIDFTKITTGVILVSATLTNKKEAEDLEKDWLATFENGVTLEENNNLRTNEFIGYKVTYIKL